MNVHERARTDPTQHWRTDPALFAALHAHFKFTVDGAASNENALLPRFWADAVGGIVHGRVDERVFINPPFVLSSEIIFAATERSERNIVILCLAKTSCSAVHEAVVHGGARIGTFPRRVQYLTPSGKAPARDGRLTSFNRDSMLLVFGFRDLEMPDIVPRTPREIAAQYGVEER